jgi:hypothetical protein
MKLIIILVTLNVFSFLRLNALIDSFDLEKNCQFIPATKKTWTYHHGLNTSFLYLPNTWLEETVSAPMIYYRANFYLPYKMAAHADIKTIGVANEIRIGAGYHYTFNKKWHAALGYQLGYNFGFLNNFGYNNDIKVIQHHPFINIGYSNKDFAFTFNAKLDLISKIYYSAGEVENTFNSKAINGYTFGLTMEQRIFKNKTFALGFNGNFMQFHILGWPAFNTIRQKFFIPEFTFGFKL